MPSRIEKLVLNVLEIPDLPAEFSFFRGPFPIGNRAARANDCLSISGYL